LKHAAVRAGLGRMGKNTLLVNDRLGNMLWLGAILIDQELAEDALANYDACIEVAGFVWMLAQHKLWMELRLSNASAAAYRRNIPKAGVGYTPVTYVAKYAHIIRG